MWERVRTSRFHKFAGSPQEQDLSNSLNFPEHSVMFWKRDVQGVEGGVGGGGGISSSPSQRFCNE